MTTFRCNRSQSGDRKQGDIIVFEQTVLALRPILTVSKLKPKTGLFRLPTSIAEPYGPKNETKSDFLLVSMFLVEKN